VTAPCQRWICATVITQTENSSSFKEPSTRWYIISYYCVTNTNQQILLNFDRRCLTVCYTECRKYFPPHFQDGHILHVDLWRLTHVVRRLIKTKAVCNECKANLKCTQAQSVRVNQSLLPQVVFKVAAFALMQAWTGVRHCLTAAAGQAHSMQ